jgi:hypothetical protein
VFRTRRYLDLALIEEDRAARPVGIARYRPGVEPPGLDLAVRHLVERHPDRLAHAQQALRHEARRLVATADDGVAQPLGERPRDPVAQRGDEVDP